MSTKWDESYAKGEGLRWWPETEFVRFLGRCYPGMSGGDRNVLDLGVGTARNLWPCYERGMICSGMDSSSESIKIAGEHMYARTAYAPCDGRYTLSVGALPRLTYADGLFDLVIDCQTIQHLADDADRREVCCEIFRVLKPGGRFWTMHYKEGDAEAVYAGVYPELKPRDFLEFTRPMVDAGLREENTELLMRTYNKCQQRIFWYISEWRKP